LVKSGVAIALDVTLATDTPGENGSCKCGVGITLGIMDNSVLGHRGLISYLGKLAEELKLDVQYDVLLAGGTDSGEIHKSKAGVINITISIPARYIHSNQGIIHRKDYCDTVTLLTEFAKRFDAKVLKELSESNR